MMRTMQTQTPRTLDRFNLSLKAAALAAGLQTGRDVAPALGIGLTAMSYKVNGKRPWKWDEVDRLAEFFGVDAAVMLAGPGEWLNRINPAKVRERLDEASSGTSDTRPYPRFAGQLAEAV